MEPPASFRRIDLADGLFVLVGRVPDLIRLPPARFEELWSMHPTAQPTVVPKGERMLVGKRPGPFRVGDGDVVVIPDATNRHFGHSVPHLPGDIGRRISVTLRSFTAPA